MIQRRRSTNENARIYYNEKASKIVPEKWGVVPFGGIKRGDIKCSQILLFTYHCKILLTMVCLVMFLPKNKFAMSMVLSLHLDCMFAHVFVVF